MSAHTGPAHNSANASTVPSHAAAMKLSLALMASQYCIRKTAPSVARKSSFEEQRAGPSSALRRNFFRLPEPAPLSALLRRPKEEPKKSHAQSNSGFSP